MKTLTLVENLRKQGITLSMKDGRLQVKSRPGTLTEATKITIIKNKQALVDFLHCPTAEGQRLLPMRPTCQEAGHCLGYTREADCELYPVKIGFCRERIGEGGWLH